MALMSSSNSAVYRLSLYSRLVRQTAVPTETRPASSQQPEAGPGKAGRREKISGGNPYPKSSNKNKNKANHTEDKVNKKNKNKRNKNKNKNQAQKNKNKRNKNKNQAKKNKDKRIKNKNKNQAKKNKNKLSSEMDVEEITNIKEVELGPL